jgi:glycosyltransferase involved in cell wall biosynthesis
LPAWYPNQTDSMAGLFVKYHALAISKYADVAVLHIITNPNQTKGIEYQYFLDGNLQTVIAYIQKRPGNFGDKLLFPLRYIQASLKGYKQIRNRFGKPDINHVHILTRAGILALYKKITTGTPYTITEHWSRYLPQNSVSYTGALHKWLTRRVANNAAVITTVSKHLGKAMQTHGLHNRYKQISNVVDVNYFTPLSPKPINIKPILLHVSCFDEKPKNVKGILDAAKQLENQGIDFELRLIGTGADWQMCVDYAQKLQLKTVNFLGLKTGDDLLKEYQTADAFILFSNFENQPVVILEAFACGLPVIATNVGGIPEIVKPGMGIIIEPKDVDALTTSILKVINTPEIFDRVAMRLHAEENFSYAGVGKQFYDIYQTVLNPKQ